MKRVLVALTVVAALGLPASAGQGSGNPRLAIDQNNISPTGVTEVTVRGYDYLVPPHAPGTSVFGGVYVIFGWVSNPASFGPSQRTSSNNHGTFGESYLYPGTGGDANLRDDGSGLVRLVSFTDGGDSGVATEYHMDDEGNWVTKVKIFGSTFSAFDPRTGTTHEVDCTQVQCGVFTIGAHGKPSATNEKFTPLDFRAPATTTTPPPPPTTTVPTTAPTTTGPTLPPAPTSTVPPAASSTTTDAGVDTPTTSVGGSWSTIPAANGSTVTTGSDAVATEVITTRSVGSPAPLVAGAGLILGVGGLGLWLRKRRTRA